MDIPVRPSTDTAVMLGLAHSLLVSGMHDEDFLESYCVGWDRYAPICSGSPMECRRRRTGRAASAGSTRIGIRALAVEMAAAEH